MAEAYKEILGFSAKENAAVPSGVYSVDSASVLYIDDGARRYRLPKGDPAFDKPGPLGAERIDREVCTERDLFNCHGTFYELPAKNAGGFAKIRPIAARGADCLLSVGLKRMPAWRTVISFAPKTADARYGPGLLTTFGSSASLWDAAGRGRILLCKRANRPTLI